MLFSAAFVKQNSQRSTPMNLRGGVVNKRFTTKSLFNVIINSDSTESTNETTKFADANNQWQYSVDTSMDPTFTDIEFNDVSLQEFFSRPIKIASFAWQTGSNLFQIIDPWTSFFTANPRVANRIINYHIMRCKMHIKIVVNGNSFFYGRACASYRPLNDFDQFGTSRGDVTNDLIAESQRPHVYINPTESRGGDLILPFLWPANAFTIPNSQWGSMGQLVLRSFGPLKHANGSEETVTVSVLAWAEDMVLAVPTSNQPSLLSPQAGPDEYEGAISKPANVLAAVAGSFASVPQVGKYAMATSTMAKAIGKVAGMYGYSKPAELSQDKVYMTPFPESSNVEGTDCTNKLSLDPKQETSIDPSIMGLGSTDEMTITSIATRESYLTSFLWETSSNPEDKLFGISVSPVLWNTNIDPLTLLQEIHMPACCFAAMPFRQWRGSMKFRFQVVCSGFHKGRLRIVYDPSSQITNEYNVNYNYVVDISNENDFTVQIGWGSDRPIIQHGSPGDEPPLFGPTHTVSPSYSHNGMLSVYVMNELTTPNSTVDNDVQVNVFVSACDDFRVFNPSVQWIDNYSYFNAVYAEPTLAALRLGSTSEEEDGSRPNPNWPEAIDLPPRLDEVYEELSPQSGLAHPDEHHTEDQDAPVQDQVTEMGNIKTSLGLDAVYYGDPIMSFRQCLKRYNYHSSLIMDTAARRWHKWTLPNFPLYRGFAPGGIHRTSADLPYNYCKNTLMNYLTPGFACVRGSIRWRYFRERGTSTNNVGQLMMVTRIPFSSSGYSYNFASVLEPNTSISSRAREVAAQIPSTWPGFAATDTWTNPVVSVDLPYYSSLKFNWARRANVTSLTENTNVNNFHQLTTSQTTVSTGQMPPRIDCYVAAGDDFSLSMFLGAPRMYRIGIGADPNPLP